MCICNMCILMSWFNLIIYAEFKQCASDFLCASGVVDDYVTKYKQNCDGIGRISCFDYAAIHLYGGENCKKVLPTKYKGRLTGCLGRILD